jgi:precorrin-6Y C5,15-methyltransferase (decarboxylating)
MSNEKPLNTQNQPWISVIGIEEDGVRGLSDLGLSLIKDCDILLAGQRHLDMVPDDLSPKAERMTWPSPFSSTFSTIAEMKGKQVVILATGDPMFCGIGGTLTRFFDWSELRVLPAKSAYSLAASRIGWPLDKCSLLTIHGRDPAGMIPHIQPSAKLIILSKNGSSPSLLASKLCEIGANEAQITVLEHMGGEKEKIIETSAHALNEAGDALPFADLNVIAVEIPSDFRNWLSTSPGLPDDAFEHDGKMTKRDIRASALTKLAPRPGAHLWDVGTGGGSIAIEWLRAAPNTSAIGLEPQEKRRTFAKHNAKALGVPRLQLIDGTAPDGLMGLDGPDAIFVGGGLSMETLNFCLDALKPGGRLVAHAVTLSSEALLLSCFNEHRGELTRLSIAKAQPVGPHFGWKASMPVTQWVYVKGNDNKNQEGSASQP